MKTKLYKPLFTLLFLFFYSLCFGQTVPGIFSGNSFEELSNKRNELSNKIPELQNQIDILYYDDTLSLLRDNSYNDYSIDFYQERIKSVSPSDTLKLRDSINAWRSNLNFFKDQRENLNYRIVNARKNIELRNSLKKQLDDTQTELIQVEYKINQLMIPKISQQNFLFWASMAFVLLMSILLFTFYFVVRNDKRVRFAIFGSDSGLQFVTLFSIIIAIILFGLTGILEGKELSALLGSIAGYILGKVKFSSEEKNSTGNQADSPNPEQQPEPKQE